MYSASVCAASFDSRSESPGQVRVLVNVGPLIVMAENDGTIAELALGRNDARFAILVRERLEAVEL